MPCKKPLVPKRRHYSRDLKRRIIYQAEVLARTSTEISINLDIPLRVIQRVKQTWNEIGEVCKDRTAMGRAPLMHPEHCKVSSHFTHGLCLNSHLLESVSARSIGTFSRYLSGWTAGTTRGATQHKGFHFHNFQYLETTWNYVQEGESCITNTNPVTNTYM